MLISVYLAFFAHNLLRCSKIIVGTINEKTVKRQMDLEPRVSADKFRDMGVDYKLAGLKAFWYFVKRLLLLKLHPRII